jgi:hypothetical protein
VYHHVWRNLRCILLRERSQSEKAAYCMVPQIQYSRKGKHMEKVKKKSLVIRE